jgi:hypothetical protein
MLDASTIAVLAWLKQHSPRPAPRVGFCTLGEDRQTLKPFRRLGIDRQTLKPFHRLDEGRQTDT